LPTITSFKWYLENRNAFVKTESDTNLVYTLHFKNRLIHNGFLCTVLINHCQADQIKYIKKTSTTRRQFTNNRKTHAKIKSCTVQYFEFHIIILHKFKVFHNHCIDQYNSLRWPIYIFNLVDITKLPCYPHRRSITVSLETFTLYSFYRLFV